MRNNRPYTGWQGPILGLALAFAIIIPLSAMPGVQPMPVPASEPDNIDRTITGSVSSSPATLATTTLPPNGTAAFQAMLKLLDSGEHVNAYQRARQLPNDLERRIIQWAAIYYGNGAIDHPSVLRFQADAPEFARAGLYKKRMEQALTKTSANHEETINLLGGQMPLTLDAQIMLANAYLAGGQRERAGRIVKHIWINNFLDVEYESLVLSRFDNLLTRQDHWQRATHLLMHDRARGTERMMDRLSPAQKTLAYARIAVSRKSANAQTLFDQVDPSLRDHPLFHFSRAQHARQKGNYRQAVTFLDAITTNVPDAAEFWYERRLITRKALAAADYQTAYAAAAGYQAGPEGRIVDARFHAGWIALSYLNDPATAIRHLQKMQSLSTLPGSITQSGYWLGKAHQALGQTDAANQAFAAAAEFQTQFYGQLSRHALGMATITLRKLPPWQASEALFNQRQLVRATRLLAANNRNPMAERMVRQLAPALMDPGELLLAARLAQSIDAHHVAILIADIANQRGVALDLFNFPKDGLPVTQLAAMDKAAIYAVARQESRFNTTAISHSGARGLMQLMPATAKETAKKVGLPYSAAKLTSDPAYNAYLGSTYLAAQLTRFDGSLVLAAAAYNAGGGNASKWIKAFGDPRSKDIDPVSWIETIPFRETRGYVQHVVANYTIYRARFNQQNLTIHQALRRILH